MEDTTEAIVTRFMRLNQLLLGKSNYSLPRKHLVHRDSLLDVLFALYEECNVDYLKRNKNINTFVDKFKSLMPELKSLRVNLKDFEVKKVIGRGHFGTVNVVREKETGDVYAMKVLCKRETLSQQNVAFYEEERDIMIESTSPWLTKLQYAFQDNQNLYLIMEFHPGGDMLSLLQRNDYVLPDDMCKFYLAELVLAIQSVHSMRYVHRDIKPDNILIDRTGHIKLADFGSASKLNNNHQVTSSMPVGTPDYVAPEVLTAMNALPSSNTGYGVECDWWSLGIVAYEMVFGSTPFANEKVLFTYNNIMNFKNFFKFPPEASEVPDSLINLIENLLQDSADRFGYNNLTTHQFFLDIDWNNIRNIAPPFLPTLSSVDDTSNFDDFEAENRPTFSDLKCRREFNGGNLPFVGFSYTPPFESPQEKSISASYCTAEESSLNSISLISTDSDSDSQMKCMIEMQKKLSQFSELEANLRSEVRKLKDSAQAREREIEIIKEEKALSDELLVELQTEIKQSRDLLCYEREHRVIIEKKAAQLIKCMKQQRKQDAILLKSKSCDINNEEDVHFLQEQLNEAFNKLDELGKEKIDLISDLYDTKQILLECQQKLTEKEQELMAASLNLNMSQSTFNDSLKNNSPIVGKKLVKKLEKKNVQLEQELDSMIHSKQQMESQILSLKKIIDELRNKDRVQLDSVEEIDSATETSIQKVSYLEKEDYETSEKQAIIAEMEIKLSLEQKVNADFQLKLQNTENDLEKHKEKLKNMKEKIKKLEDEISMLKIEKNNALSDARLEVKTSARKEQLADSLRERNKDLREQLKAKEQSILEKSKTEEDLKAELKTLNSEVKELKEQLVQKEKQFEIEKAKFEERVRTMKDTCEVSKDVNQKYAKSQGQYEEITKQNINLTQECEEKTKKIVKLLEEVKILKSDLSKSESECTRKEKINATLKSACIDMENDLNDLETLIEVRDVKIAKLVEERDKLQFEIRKCKDELRGLQSSLEKDEQQREGMVKHAQELTLQIETQNALHESELQMLQDQLEHYKKCAADLEKVAEDLQNNVTSRNKDTTTFSKKILDLESQLCVIKEEAASHITQMSSLKSSNLKLTQTLEAAVRKQQEAEKIIKELYNEQESEKAKYGNEKVKLQETILQQTKLIDFLQTKTENMEKKKRPIARLFGKKDIPSQPVQSRDLEKLLETERSRCRRLQDQLSQARAEKMALQREVSNLSETLSAQAQAPATPKSRAMHSAITYSPNSRSDTNSPLLDSSNDTVEKIIKPPGMKHKIPHRFSEIMCMRNSKCCICLDSIYIGRSIVKCQECLLECHPKCSSSLPKTCGLPSGFMQHFKAAVQNSASSDKPQYAGNKPEGWIKVPKSNKHGWDRRYMRLKDDVLYIFEKDQEDLEDALMELEFTSNKSTVSISSAVSATELPYAASSDLPYVFRIESFPLTTCWPKRCLYIMTSNFTEKQMWVSVLEKLAEKNQTETENCQKKLEEKPVWTLKGNKVIDPLCTSIFDKSLILLGATEGLFILSVTNEGTLSLTRKIDEVPYVYQIICLKNAGLFLLIHGEDRKLCLTHFDNLQSRMSEASNQPLVLKSVADVKNCHLFAVDENSNADSPYICIATSQTIMLCQYDSGLKAFYKRKVINVNEPCSCILFNEESMIFGTDVFYELDLKDYSIKSFLDGSDSSLAGLVYCAPQFRSFPVAILKVSGQKQYSEYLLCFHEMGIFIDSKGRRTRAEDMKWSRLPLSFAYRSPYLFITHFNSVEVIEITHPADTNMGNHACMSVQNAQYMGWAPTEMSILISSKQNQSMSLIEIDGSSIGKSTFYPPTNGDSDTAASRSPGSNCVASIPESEDLDFSFTSSIEQGIEPFDEQTLSEEYTES